MIPRALQENGSISVAGFLEVPERKDESEIENEKKKKRPLIWRETGNIPPY